MKKALLIAGIIGAGLVSNEVNAQSAKDYNHFYEDISKIGVSDQEDFIEQIAEKNPKIEEWNDDKQDQYIALTDNGSISDILNKNRILKTFLKQDKLKEKYGTVSNPKTNEIYFIEVTKRSTNPHQVESFQLSIFDTKSGWFKRGYYDDATNNSKKYINKKSNDAFLVGDARNGIAQIYLNDKVNNSTMKALNAAYHDDVQYVLSVMDKRHAPKKTYKPDEMDPNMRILLNLPRK